MLNISQSLLRPDQYRFGIKSPVLLYSSDSDYSTILITTYNSINSIDYTTMILQLETALCYQHYFCNTELRTAIITEIKGLSIQTQQNTFVLFTLFKLTSDERKTLTKISMHKTSHNHSPNQRTPQTTTKRQTAGYKKRKRLFAHLGKNKNVGILDLRSIGYFKVGYQKMVNMAESSKAFKMYHYQQVKCETRAEVYQYMRITGRYGYEKSKRMLNNEEQIRPNHKSDPYPWLADDDPKRYQSDEEIMYEKIDLSNSALSRKEKAKLMKMLIKYRDAFSLRDEIGECSNLEADIKVIDESPFFVRPFPVSEGDKPFMDKQMKRLVSLGILSKNSTSHTSPVMLITRKLTKDKRPVVDFRLLNTRILRRNTSIPLMSDVLDCEVVSCVDIKDAYHSIRLTEKSKEYCGILPYFGSPIYRYEVLPMGIACAPQIWMDYITLTMAELEDKKRYIAIMDDLLIHSTKVAHWKLLEQLLKSMCKNGLRLSPKKCQLFKTK